jgi:hypothetical protein
MVSDAEQLAEVPVKSSAVERIRRGLAPAAVLYAVMSVVLIAIVSGSPGSWRALPDWIAVRVLCHELDSDVRVEPLAPHGGRAAAIARGSMLFR